jgi:hypothetical protein
MFSLLLIIFFLKIRKPVLTSFFWKHWNLKSGFFKSRFLYKPYCVCLGGLMWCKNFNKLWKGNDLWKGCISLFFQCSMVEIFWTAWAKLKRKFSQYNQYSYCDRESKEYFPHKSLRGYRCGNLLNYLSFCYVFIYVSLVCICLDCTWFSVTVRESGCSLLGWCVQRDSYCWCFVFNLNRISY